MNVDLDNRFMRAVHTYEYINTYRCTRLARLACGSSETLRTLLVQMRERERGRERERERPTEGEKERERELARFKKSVSMI